MLFLGICIYLLASTADAYLSPALEMLSDKFNCSESLAGVTLLALGNGAPDVFSAMAAGGTSESSVNQAISQVFGSALFISSFVTAVTTKASVTDGKIQLTKSFFLRDWIFLNVCSIYILWVAFFYKQFDMLVSAGFIVLYVIFVIVVVAQSKIQKSQMQNALTSEAMDADDQNILTEAIVAQDFTKMIAARREAG